ncbi:MAG: RNA polymerase sigma factor [Planctomycetota bacterium]
MPVTTQPPAADVFAGLVDSHQAGVWRFLRALGCDGATADDLTQETFLELLQSAFEHRSDSETAAFLRKVARSRWLKLRQRRQRAAEVPLEAGDDDGVAVEAAWQQWHPDGTGSDDVLAAMRDCVAGLAPKAQQALTRQYLEDTRGEQVAESLGMPFGSFRVFVQRARQTVKDCMSRKLRLP